MGVSGDLAGESARRARVLASLEELELVIEKIVTGGEGLGRHEGIPVLVEGAAPGDLLRVEVVERHPAFARGKILEILKAGPERREPPCPYYDRCGGCDFQHLSEAAQRQAKLESTVETLRRLGRLDVSGKLSFRGEEQDRAYRRRAQFNSKTSEERTRLGFFARKSNDIVEVESCLVLRPELDQLLMSLRRESPGALPRRLDVAVDDQGRVGVAPVRPGLPGGTLQLSVGEDVLEFDARCFVQSHGGLTQALVDYVLEGFPPAQEGKPAGRALDLYCGIGLFTLGLARRFEQVVAVDSDRVATRFAKNNAKSAGLKNVSVVHKRVEQWTKDLPEARAAVVDPPRSGLPRSVRAALLDSSIETLVYVSCQPATLARDLAGLSLGFKFVQGALFDLFPQTSHVETVIHLRRS